MGLTRQQVLDSIYRRTHISDADSERGGFHGSRGARFTQDTPVYPDVWAKFAESRGALDNPKATAKDKKAAEAHRLALLLTPHSDSSTQVLVQRLRFRLARERKVQPEHIRLPYNESHVLAELTYREMLRVALPLTNWWSRHLMQLSDGTRVEDLGAWLNSLQGEKQLAELLLQPAKQDAQYSEDLLDFARIAGTVGLARAIPPRDPELAKYCRECANFLGQILNNLPLEDVREDMEAGNIPPLWSIFLNRRAHTAVNRSREAVKADAAGRVFEISTKGIVWAVIDSGVDATHPAFLKTAKAPLYDAKGRINTRVAATYDFTVLADIIGGSWALLPERVRKRLDSDSASDLKAELTKQVQAGRPVDWKLIEPLIRIPHVKDEYRPPVHEHGTHVAGILAANWPDAEGQTGAVLKGICPELEIYDLRVFNDKGEGDEFAVMAALQFTRHLNEHKDRMMVHGVNLSMSMLHDVETFGCGSTPVCEECQRVIGTGVVCVAAAGNQGWENCRYQAISITDPGNGEDVITVGATHRTMPHKYGVSYFSSRGPTGDGRAKPDLVAPGEKIHSTIPGAKAVTLDGTSQAAPHVSGAAVLLMARHRELIGKPLRIKEILCRTATDLGRERFFQGAGMLDILRALQSV